MNIISCENCGVVLNTDCIEEPEMYDDNSDIIQENVCWRHRDYILVITCPCCKEKTPYKGDK